MNPVVALGVAAISIAIGLLVLRSHRARIGWLLVAHGVFFGALLVQPSASTSRGGRVADQLAAGSWVFLFLWLVLAAYVLPDGHSLSPRWRRWMQVCLVGVVLFLVGSAGDTAEFRDAHDGADPPLTWLPAPVSTLLGVVGLLLTVLFFFGAGFAVRARLRRSSGDDRLQLLWLVWGGTSLPLALVLAWVAHFLLDDSSLVEAFALTVAGATLPVCIGIAILRHRLFDIQLVLSRTLTYAVLVVAVIALYAVLLLGADRLLGESTVGGLVAVGIVAVAVHPAYALLRRRIERWVYGYRSDPAAALRRLSASVESADPLHVVDTITTSIADALKVDLVWVNAPGGPEHPGTTNLPLVHRGDHIGDLVVEVPAGRRLSGADTALLHDLARQAAVTVRAAQLAAELQTSRSNIVTAREEERKRLRRDLHDGVGPSLAGILLRLQAAQSRRDEAERDAILTEIRDETREAITEIRRVVDDLRPPAIDEVGLVGAIRQRAASLSTRALIYEINGPDAMPSLPAAVEVAAFRIASEAMTNVARHSGATRCRLDLELDVTLGLTVSDNGHGSSLTTTRGVGWTSMTERAAELGGSCTISSRREGGLVVRAVLPLSVPARDPAGMEAAP